MRSRNVPRSVPPSLRRRPRLASGALAATMLLAACGGDGDPAPGAEADVDVPATDATPTDTATTDTATTGDSDSSADDGAPAGTEAPVDAAPDAAPPAVDGGRVDLVGPDVLDASNIETNLLPDVVVDDLTNDRKVNFRNLVPQGKPVLLWMWAPH